MIFISPNIQSFNIRLIINPYKAGETHSAGLACVTAFHTVACVYVTCVPIIFYARHEAKPLGLPDERRTTFVYFGS